MVVCVGIDIHTVVVWYHATCSDLLLCIGWYGTTISDPSTQARQLSLSDVMSLRIRFFKRSAGVQRATEEKGGLFAVSACRPWPVQRFQKNHCVHPPPCSLCLAIVPNRPTPSLVKRNREVCKEFFFCATCNSIILISSTIPAGNPLGQACLLCKKKPEDEPKHSDPSRECLFMMILIQMKIEMLFLLPQIRWTPHLL